jgi:hypothetical protein
MKFTIHEIYHTCIYKMFSGSHRLANATAYVAVCTAGRGSGEVMCGQDVQRGGGGAG